MGVQLGGKIIWAVYGLLLRRGNCRAAGGRHRAFPV